MEEVTLVRRLRSENDVRLQETKRPCRVEIVVIIVRGKYVYHWLTASDGHHLLTEWYMVMAVIAAWRAKK